MKVTVLGCGYVGLVSGVCFAEFGVNVVCCDLDKEKIDKLMKANVPIYEPGLESLLKKNINENRLSFSYNLGDSIPSSDLIFIAVGTPARRGDGHADLSYVYQAAEDLAPLLEGYTVVVDKSTVPVGTARNVKKIISDLNPDADFDVASNPEFLREGAAISDFMRPDRVVIGVENKRSENLLRELYRPTNLIEAPIISTDLESAELIKYASNAFLATKISFINEMSMICEKTGADIHAVARGMGLDNRIGRKFLHPGPGYGGSCFPKDTKALARIASENGISSRIVETVIEVNEIQKMRMIEKICHAIGENADTKKIAILGLTFKPETDDMRDAPSLTILPELIKRGIKINAHDPKGVEEAKKILPSSVEYFDDIYKSMEGTDAVVLMTEWNVYRNMDMLIVKEKLNTPVFIDLRNVYEPKEMQDYGFDYFSVGR
ncbi:MAG: UDP-glucose 6-dehydrogenase [Legionellales bacterium]|jgi:UDPglucose 6-dehydrogenase|nr:UDP-glucose 6-dehydrogenase [Legionellales bacterium]HBH10657.1 UDP-glucose 6-dehydrogenase [Gammaproteobacteria bacterium]|tara:strand:+ start:304 stop:1608 length:1305 start_codon:yes stop_codon:yes gene_type:complete